MTLLLTVISVLSVIFGAVLAGSGIGGWSQGGHGMYEGWGAVMGAGLVMFTLGLAYIVVA